MVLKEQLERLVDEMVSRGVCFEDARREFEKKFISHVLLEVRRKPVPGRRYPRHPPQHAEPQDCRIPPPPPGVLTPFFGLHYNWQSRGVTASSRALAPVKSRA